MLPFKWTLAIALMTLAGLGGPVGCSPAASPTAASAPALAPATRADHSGEVFLIVNHVKGDRRQQFERLLREDLEPATRRASQGAPYFSPSEVAYDTRPRRRTLHPQQEEPDGTYTYVFVFVPASPGETPSLEQLFLSVGMAPERVAGVLRSFEDSFARPPEQYHLTLSEPWASRGWSCPECGTVPMAKKA